MSIWKNILLNEAIESDVCKSHCWHGAMYPPSECIGHHGFLARVPNVFVGNDVNEKYCCYCGEGLPTSQEGSGGK